MLCLVYRFLHFAVQSAQHYFPCTVFVEDEEALKPGRPYIVGKQSSVTYLSSCVDSTDNYNLWGVQQP